MTTSLNLSFTVGAAPSDGSANAPPGTGLFAGQLNSYKSRPSWKVAGVDYAVGIDRSKYPTNASLKNPLTGALPAGVTRDSTGHKFSIMGNNVIIDGWDFSLGGWEVDVNSGSGCIIQNNNFKCSSNGNLAVYITPGCSNATLQNNEIDGSGFSTTVEFPIAFNGSGTTIIQYNYIHDAWGQTIVGGSALGGEDWYLRYNVIANSGEGSSAGAHGDFIQNYNQSSSITTHSRTVSYNFFIQNEAGANTQGVTENGQAGYMDYDYIINNTFVTTTTAIISWGIIKDPTWTVTAVQIENNFFDLTGVVYGWLLYLNTGGPHGPWNPTVTKSGNTNMLTGATLT